MVGSYRLLSRQHPRLHFQIVEQTSGVFYRRRR